MIARIVVIFIGSTIFLLTSSGVQAEQNSSNSDRTENTNAILDNHSVIYFRSGPYSWHEGTIINQPLITSSEMSFNYRLTVDPPLPDGLRLKFEPYSTSYSGSPVVELYGTAREPQTSTDYLLRLIYADIDAPSTTDWFIRYMDIHFQIEITDLDHLFPSEHYGDYFYYKNDPVNIQIDGSTLLGQPPYSYTIEPDLPEGVTINSVTGSIIGKTMLQIIKRPYYIQVEDSTGAIDRMSIYLEFSERNRHPTVSQLTVADQKWSPGQKVELILPQRTSGSPPFSYKVTGLPDWLLFNEKTRTISGIAKSSWRFTSFAKLTYLMTDSENTTEYLEFRTRVMSTTFWGDSFEISLQEGTLNEIMIHPWINQPVSVPIFEIVEEKPTWLNIKEYGIGEEKNIEGSLDIEGYPTSSYPTFDQYAPFIWGTPPLGQDSLTLTIKATMPYYDDFWTDTDTFILYMKFRTIDVPKLVEPILPVSYKTHYPFRTFGNQYTCNEFQDPIRWGKIPTADRISHVFIENVRDYIPIGQVAARDVHLMFDLSPDPEWFSLTKTLKCMGGKPVYSLFVTGIPSEIQEETSHTITMYDIDRDKLEFSFNIEVEEDTRPTFSDDGNHIIYLADNQNTNTKLPTAIGGNGRLTYNLLETSNNTPDNLYGLQFNPKTNTLNGTPTVEQDTTHLYQLIATDQNLDTAIKLIRIIIDNDDTPTEMTQSKPTTTSPTTSFQPAVATTSTTTPTTSTPTTTSVTISTSTTRKTNQPSFITTTTTALATPTSSRNPILTVAEPEIATINLPSNSFSTNSPHTTKMKRDEASPEGAVLRSIEFLVTISIATSTTQPEPTTASTISSVVKPPSSTTTNTQPPTTIRSSSITTTQPTSTTLVSKPFSTAPKTSQPTTQSSAAIPPSSQPTNTTASSALTTTIISTTSSSSTTQPQTTDQPEPTTTSTSSTTTSTSFFASSNPTAIPASQPTSSITAPVIIGSQLLPDQTSAITEPLTYTITPSTLPNSYYTGSTTQVKQENANQIIIILDDIATNTHQNNIQQLANLGITQGCSQTSYCPQRSVTRAEMATFLVRAFPLPTTTQDQFTDDTHTTHHHNINIIATAGITQGCAHNRHVDQTQSITHLPEDHTEPETQKKRTPLNTQYCPNRPITRAEMAVFITRILNLPTHITTTNPPAFQDLKPNHPTQHIQAIANAGITQGCNPTNKLYCPNRPVTRAEMATFLVRALRLTTTTNTNHFTDTAGNTHQQNVNTIAQAGITQGCYNNNYCPNRPVTRAEMATFLIKAINHQEVTKTNQ